MPFCGRTFTGFFLRYLAFLKLFLNNVVLQLDWSIFFGYIFYCLQKTINITIVTDLTSFEKNATLYFHFR